ncbi:MAG: hypothetical protein HC921_15860 [Synechococcaceae cyanobacterium SM2_3_1]|nr:hypothetical protein [Synechococcaceae cyanobacterium SM2_3_1]
MKTSPDNLFSTRLQQAYQKGLTAIESRGSHFTAWYEEWQQQFSPSTWAEILASLAQQLPIHDLMVRASVSESYRDAVLATVASLLTQHQIQAAKQLYESFLKVPSAAEMGLTPDRIFDLLIEQAHTLSQQEAPELGG